MRMRACARRHLRQHVVLLGLELLDLALHRHERGLGRVGVLLRGVEIGLQLGDLLLERVLLLDQDDGEIVLVGLDRDVDRSALDLRELLALRGEPLARLPRAGE